MIVYILANASDISNGVPGLSAEVREFCKTKECLKKFLRMYFDGESSNVSEEWCCSNCD